MNTSPEWQRLLAVSLGGALGSTLRHLMNKGVPPLESGLPLSTLMVNVAGSFAMGLILARGGGGSDLRILFLTTGVLGGFTTYSAFNQETLTLLRQGPGGLAVVYLGLTVVLCLGFGWVGTWLGRASW